MSINASGYKRTQSENTQRNLYPKLQPWAGAGLFIGGLVSFFISAFRMQSGRGWIGYGAGFIGGLVAAWIGGVLFWVYFVG